MKLFLHQVFDLVPWGYYYDITENKGEVLSTARLEKVAKATVFSL